MIRPRWRTPSGELGSAATYAASAADCARQADVLVITTAWPEFKNLTPADLKPGDQPANGALRLWIAGASCPRICSRTGVNT